MKYISYLQWKQMTGLLCHFRGLCTVLWRKTGSQVIML